MIKTAIITLSDRAHKKIYKDESGPAIAEALLESGMGFQVVKYILIPDDKNMLKRNLKALADKLNVDLILTTGGTGLSSRDITPEATKEVIEKEVPGFSEIIRSESFKFTRKSILSRAVSGIRGKALIINLPGSPKAVKQSLGLILPAIQHAVEIIKGEARE